jgi:hypothetical protein
MLVRLTSPGEGNKEKLSNERLTEQQVCEPMRGIQFVTWLNSLFHDFTHNLLVKDRKCENTFVSSGYSFSKLLLNKQCTALCTSVPLLQRWEFLFCTQTYWAGPPAVRFPAGVKRLFFETSGLAVGPTHHLTCTNTDCSKGCNHVLVDQSTSISSLDARTDGVVLCQERSF